jgi:hypothetical protein
MPPANNDLPPTQAKQILAELQKLRQDIDRVNRNVEQSSQGKQRADQNTGVFNQNSDDDYNATRWMMPLSFILIAIATITVIVSTALGQ